ncbi:MAG: SDR family oxidoreductase [Clostridia bacterium]
MDGLIFADRFLGKTMIITGAASGIGRATALRAAREGAKVVLVDRKKEEGTQVAREIQASGGEGHFLWLDLTHPGAAEEMVDFAVRTFGKLDIAINNAGVMGSPSPAHLLQKKDLDYTMDNNFVTVFYSCRAELAHFVERGAGGVIVNNASIAGLTGLPGHPAYVASKHAVNGLTRNLALDYARFGIRVNSVNPAGTNTPMIEEAAAFVKAGLERAISQGVDPAQAQSMAGQKTQTMQKRDAEAFEQAASILFLASEDASHITGTLFATDGGWTAF